MDTMIAQTVTVHETPYSIADLGSEWRKMNAEHHMISNTENHYLRLELPCDDERWQAVDDMWTAHNERVEAIRDDLHQEWSAVMATYDAFMDMR